ncbi:MAG: outer membrane lipid asymmetry maintenance protein MlaD [Desulfobacteraceae bacterium]|nr:outer membrane lipid asymmetry maintenance protein MlaD [Desulfobacteraceae bacterium]
MQRGKIETAVGIFILAGLLCVAYLAIRLGRMEWFNSGYYNINASFTSVSGLKNGASVEMAGVEVGQVEKISLDEENHMAIVELRIKDGLQVSDDTIASVKTAGLIGDKFIKLTPGGSTKMLKPGDTIFDTESTLDIEELISKFAFGKV